jgi:high-affinity K+ transport system ATPase subunit B
MTERKAAALWDGQIVKGALVDSLRKFDPRIQARNPVMFVVEVTALAVTVILCRDFFLGRGAPNRAVAVVHRTVRQFRGGDGRGTRQGPGRQPAQDPH